MLSETCYRNAKCADIDKRATTMSGAQCTDTDCDPQYLENMRASHDEKMRALLTIGKQSVVQRCPCKCGCQNENVVLSETRYAIGVKFNGSDRDRCLKVYFFCRACREKVGIDEPLSESTCLNIQNYPKAVEWQKDASLSAPAIALQT